MQKLTPVLALAGAALVAIAAAPPSRQSVACDPGNGGLTLPAGFCATVFADSAGTARHIAVAPNGDVFVNVRAGRSSPGGILVLRDTDGDGHADVRNMIADSGNTGIALANGYVYASRPSSIVRYPLKPGLLTLDVAGPAEVIVRDLPTKGHTAHNFVVDGRTLYVNIGSESNSCQEKDRSNESPGIDPCTQLDERAGIWMFDAAKTDQTRASGQRFATGIRNAVALALNPADGFLYAVFHGRDQLFANWPALYTAEESAELPAEELIKITRGADFGWPYCYYDQLQKKLVLAPEYGGDGKKIGRCSAKQQPLFGFPGHWAPDGLLFYTARQFPAKYRAGAFVAFHGSWNRAPLPQAGYRVVFVPIKNGVAGKFVNFATGFATDTLLKVDRPSRVYRPVGLAQGPSGALYVSDDFGGRIWRIVWRN